MTNEFPGADPPGATPLSDDDLDGLVPTFVATRADLNLAEHANIESATRWAFGARAAISTDRLLTTTFVDEVHRRMFGNVWRWAGTRRTRQTNIGVDPRLIPEQLHLLLGDVRYWHDNDVFGADEVAVRLHHRLVSIHPYRNGNGRHARFVADVYLRTVGQPRLPWGYERPTIERRDTTHPADWLGETGDATRQRYIACLRVADRGDITPLLDFARS